MLRQQKMTSCVAKEVKCLQKEINPQGFERSYKREKERIPLISLKFVSIVQPVPRVRILVFHLENTNTKKIIPQEISRFWKL